MGRAGPTGLGLLDAMRAASSPSVPGCKVRRILNALADGDRADLTEALTDPSVTSAAIARVLTAAGHSTSEDPVRKHRNGRCSCGRAG